MSRQNIPDSFLSLLKQFGELPDKAVTDIEERIQLFELPKKHLLVKKGSVCNCMYFISKGMARNFYEEDGKEMTTDIVLEGELLVSFSSFITRHPSRESIEMLENSVLQAIHYDDLQYLYLTYPVLERIGRLIAEHYYISLSAKNYRYKFSSAAERYEQLFRSKIEIVKRAPIGVIASYLGMSIETLSRIRSKQD